MQITCKEYENVSIRENELKDAEIHQFQLQADAAAKKLRVPPNEIFYRTHNSLKFGSVVGILAIPTRTIEVLPKIDGAEEKIRNTLIRMLVVAEDLPISSNVLSTLKTQRLDLLEILIRIFAKQLHVAIGKGIPRRYELNQEDISVFRGKLNVTRQFTRYAGRADRLACIWDEMTENTPLNRVLKAAVHLLFRLSKSTENRRLLSALLDRYDLVDDSRTPLCERVSLDRSNARFHDLYKFALLFLSGQYQSTTSGQGLGITMLFSMNQLFENFIGKCLKRALEPKGYKVHLQHKSHYAIWELNKKSRLFNLQPDVVIETIDDKNDIILDTKWKVLDRSDNRRGVSQSDVYQVLAYGRAYDASRIILLYPWHQNISQSDGIKDEWEANDSSRLPLDVVTVDLSKDPREIVDRLPILIGLHKIGTISVKRHRSN